MRVLLVVVIAASVACNSSKTTKVGGYTLAAGGVVFAGGVVGYSAGDTSGDSPSSHAHMDAWLVVIGGGIVLLGVGAIVALVGLASPSEDPAVDARRDRPVDVRASRAVGIGLGADGLWISDETDQKRSLLPAALATFNATDDLSVDGSVGWLANSNSSSLVGRLGLRYFLGDWRARGFTGNDQLSPFLFARAGFGYTDYGDGGRKDLAFLTSGVGSELVLDSGLSFWLETGPALVRAEQLGFPPAPGGFLTFGISFMAGAAYRFSVATP